MDIEKYIASGILESYVLGELSQQEMFSVDKMAEDHPEVLKELLSIQEALGELALETAINPNPKLKSSILNEVEKLEVRENTIRKSIPNEHIKSQKTTQLNYWIAASVVTFILFGGLTLYYWLKWQNTEEKLKIIVSQNQVLSQNFKTASQQLTKSNFDLKILQNPDFKKITLKGVETYPNSLAVVYWNATSSEVFLNPNGLPSPPDNKQYQLWAIIDGKPVDAGIFNFDLSNLIKMKEATNASAFAITLEPKGGKNAPTLEQMYVIGNV